MHKFQVKSLETKSVGAAHDQLTRTPGGVLKQMGNAATIRPSHYNTDRDGEAEQIPADDIFFRRSNSDPKMAKKNCCGKGCCPAGCCGKEWWLKALLYALTIATAIVALLVLVLSVTSAIATKIYSSDLSGRIVGLIILAVSAAGTLTALLIVSVYYFKKNYKVVSQILSVLLILALIQAILAGVTVKVTQNNEITLARSLIESFRLAREGNPRHAKIWSDTQYNLDCCGVYSSEDYRRPGVPTYFPPDVPISCCPSFDPKRSELVQERNREICKSRVEFYREGCKGPVVAVFKTSSVWVLVVVIVLIILQVLEVAVAVILLYNKKPGPKPHPEDGLKDKPQKDKENEKEKEKPKPKEKEKHKEKDKEHGKK